MLGVMGLIVGGRTAFAPSQGTVSQAEEAAAERVLPVETIAIKPVERYAVQRYFTGEIAALRASNLGFERSGTLVAVLVDEGDRVAVGQPLARLDVRNLEAQKLQLLAERDRARAELSELIEGPRQEDIAAARATVRDLEEQLRLQELQRSRRQFLFEEGAISQEQLDEFSYGAAALRARIDRAESDLAELLNGSRSQDIAAQQAVVRQLDASIADLDVTIAKSTIRAPFDGIVSERVADEGTVVSAGQSALRILERAAPEARIGVPSNMLDQLTPGRSVTVELAGQPRRARIESILPQVESVTRTQEVVLALDAVAIERVSPGQTVRLQLTETIEAQGYWLPTAALTQGIRGLWNCYVVVPAAAGNGAALKFEARARTVEIVHQEGDRVLVRGTLQPGDRIVADGTHRLVPGQPVQIPSETRGLAARHGQ